MKAMARLLGVFAAAFIVLYLSAAGTFAEFRPSGSIAAAQDPKAITVYVTKTGQKYHRDGCRYLSRSRIPMSLAEAAKRFSPCSVCRPPVLKLIG
jgi:hypothetical protein